MNEAKQEILNVCLKYFLKHGVRKMTNDNLVALLGISTKTLYKHFKDKEDLLSQALDLFYSQQDEILENFAQHESAPVFLFHVWQEGFEMEFNVNNAFFQDLHYYYPELEKNVEARHVKKIWHEFIQRINKGKKEGDLREDIIPIAVLESMSVLYVSAVRTDNFTNLGLSLNEILQSTLVAYIRGLCTSKGARILDKHIANLKSPAKTRTSKRYAINS